MFRNLRAIEIAEGALLADIAVAFQFLVIILPVGGGFFTMLNIIVFTVLVLRQGLYVGALSIATAIFLLCILVGPHGAASLFTDGLAGGFLGLAMKYRLPHLLIVLLGALAASIYLFGLTIGVAWLTGVPFATYIRGIHRAYNLVLPIVALVAQRLGLGAFWQHNLYPLVTSLSQWIFTYWLVTFYVLLLLVCIPAILVLYAADNSFVRMLGYNVRPLLEGKVGHWVHRARHRVVTLILKRKARVRRWNKA
ncbi:hypothetical protein [Dictyobacter kobayashii]|uniref:DUF2232 domain-containing protein n=1 Tax=Dictyobacter kobayashii TaxID=2014872 RepID=A0A402APM5_9CHLR|nr:hypothetical protein [Dictyobacter kobayashii]GCE21067.1 hypothetical protein KDK_48670 [Dictyobacter kobayashii]